MKRTVLLIITVPLVFSACNGKTPSTTNSTSLAPPVVANLASDIGCTGLDQSGQTELYTRENGLCDLGDETIIIYTFETDALKDQWIAAAQAAGGVLVEGDQWIVITSTQAIADAVKAKIGGEFRLPE